MAPEPQRSIGPYEIVRSLGQGGMGEVLLARDPSLDRQVAIKRVHAAGDLDDLGLERFRREARMAARLSHPSIVSVYHLLETDGSEFIVMEYVPGTTLRDRLGSGPLPVDDGLRIARMIAEGLSYAHRRDVLHRDLKTENILLGVEGQVKIADFGLARPLSDDEAPLTRTGLVMGTTRAMSPEQACGDQVDARTDLFSLGVLFYEMFTGTSPFEAENNAQTLKRVVFDRHEPANEHVPELPPELVALIDRLLEKEPENRPDGPENVLRALLEIGGRVSSSDVTAVSPLPASAPSTMRTGTVWSGAATSSATTAERTRGERRQVTVMACDLVSLGDGSGHSLDPETLYEVMPAFQRLAREVVERYEGHVASALGHRLLVYFGYPEVHEDEGRRAVLAALELVARGAELERGGDAESLALRVGIHTGPAVSVDGGAPGDELLLGPTLDLATQVQLHAVPDAVAISETTRRTVEGFFISERIPEAAIGPGGRLPVHRVLRARGVFSRVETGENLAPLIGRQRELDLMLDRWAMARDGQGQVVAVGGEAGFGKSRLMHVLRERLREDGAQLLLTHGDPYAGNTPLAPIVELLRKILGVDADAPVDQRRQTLLSGLERLGLEPEEAGRDVAPLLGVPWPDDEDAQLAVGAETRRRRTFDTLLSLVGELAARRPLTLIVEDLHWVDPTTLELLGILIEQCEGASLLLVVTFRPSFTEPWKHSHLTRIHLGRLAEKDAVALLDVLGRGRLTDEMRDEILARSDGVPLYLEELTRVTLEDDSATTGHVPATLQASLQARLDRLRGGKTVAQLAAVCGRELTFDLLRAASPLPEIELSRHLDRLVESGILQRRGLGRNIRYAFRHALLQDAALETLLASDRRELNRDVARALETEFPKVEAESPERLAHHWEEAQSYERAAELYGRAGDRSRDTFAIAEALVFYQRAASLVERLRARQPRDARLIATAGELAEIRGDLLTQVARYDEAREAYEEALETVKASADGDGASGGEPTRRARRLRKIGATYSLAVERDAALPPLDRALRALPPEAERTAADHEEAIQIELERLNVHYFQGEVEEIEAIGRRLVPTIERWGSPRQRAKLHASLLARGLRRDRYQVDDETLGHARTAYEAALEIGDAEGIADARFNVAFAELLRGDLDEAMGGFQETLELAQKIEQRLIETASRSYIALVHRLQDQVEETARAAEALTDEGQVGALYVGLAHALLAWVAWRRGDDQEAERQGREALGIWNRATSAFPFMWTALLPLLATRADDGPDALDEAARDEITTWADALVDETQQRLPPTLARRVETLRAETSVPQLMRLVEEARLYAML